MQTPATDPQRYPYATYLDIKFAPLTVVDVPVLVAQCREQWYNQTLCKVNDSVSERCHPPDTSARSGRHPDGGNRLDHSDGGRRGIECSQSVSRARTTAMNARG